MFSGVFAATARISLKVNKSMKKGPKFKRKESTKQRWLKAHELKRIPPGKVLDHKIPLKDGGSDSLRNLHLVKKKFHKGKTRAEARMRAKKRK